MRASTPNSNSQWSDYKNKVLMFLLRQHQFRLIGHQLIRNWIIKNLRRHLFKSIGHQKLIRNWIIKNLRHHLFKSMGHQINS